MNKRNFLSKFIIGAAVTVALVACGGGGDSGPSVSIAKYEAIKLGMTVLQVEAIMGGPANVILPPLNPELDARIWRDLPLQLTVTFKGGVAWIKAFDGTGGAPLSEGPL